MGQTKVKGSTASIVQCVFGVLLVAMGIIGMGSSLWYALFFLFLGAFLIASGVEWRLLIKAYRLYSVLLESDPSGSIANISNATNTSQKAVKDNLNLMIKKGMAPNMAVDEQGGCVVTRLQGQAAAPNPSAVVIPAARREVVTVLCSGCGAANNVTRGVTSECGHCGAPISA